MKSVLSATKGRFLVLVRSFSRSPGPMPEIENATVQTPPRPFQALGRGLATYGQRSWVRCLLLALFGAGVHIPALQGQLIWDDLYLARDNPLIKSPLLILETFRHYLFPDSYAGHYRPDQNLTYIFDYLVWNTDSYGFHLSSFLWHVASGVLLYFLLEQLLRSLAGHWLAKSGGDL